MVVATDSIQYPIALNSHKDLISAISAEKNQDYFCIECSDKMILRRGEVKRPHFAHVSKDRVCNPESALHKAGKRVIKEMIQNGIDNGTPVLFRYKCQYCGNIHEDNIDQEWSSAKEEYTIKIKEKTTRPDIVVLDENGEPFFTIEVVVTHYPDAETVDAFKLLAKDRIRRYIAVFVVEIKENSLLFDPGQTSIFGYFMEGLPYNPCEYADDWLLNMTNEWNEDDFKNYKGIIEIEVDSKEFAIVTGGGKDQSGRGVLTCYKLKEVLDGFEWNGRARRLRGTLEHKQYFVPVDRVTKINGYLEEGPLLKSHLDSSDIRLRKLCKKWKKWF